jgi:hypothetical protein
MASKYNKVEAPYFEAYGAVPVDPKKNKEGGEGMGRDKNREILVRIVIFSDFPPMKPITIYQANACS